MAHDDYNGECLRTAQMIELDRGPYRPVHDAWEEHVRHCVACRRRFPHVTAGQISILRDVLPDFGFREEGEDMKH